MVGYFFSNSSKLTPFVSGTVVNINIIDIIHIKLNILNVIRQPNLSINIGKRPVVMKLKIKLKIIAILIACPLNLKGKTSEINNNAIGPSDIEKEII